MGLPSSMLEKRQEKALENRIFFFYNVIVSNEAQA